MEVTRKQSTSKFRKTNISSGGKKYWFFENFSVLCFLVTSVWRFAFFSCYRRSNVCTTTIFPVGSCKFKVRVLDKLAAQCQQQRHQIGVVWRHVVLILLEHVFVYCVNACILMKKRFIVQNCRLFFNHCEDYLNLLDWQIVS